MRKQTSGWDVDTHVTFAPTDPAINAVSRNVTATYVVSEMLASSPSFSSSSCMRSNIRTSRTAALLDMSFNILLCFVTVHFLQVNEARRVTVLTSEAVTSVFLGFLAVAPAFLPPPALGLLAAPAAPSF